MPDNILKGIVSITAPGVKQTFAEIETGAKKTEQALQGVGLPLSRFQEKAKTFAADAKKSFVSIIPPISQLGDSIETLRAKLFLKQQALIEEKDIQNVARLNQEIEKLQSEIIRISNVGKTGFDALGNAIVKPITPISRLTEQLKKGAGQFTVIGQAGKLAGSNLGSLSGVLNTTASNITPLVAKTSSLATGFTSVAGGAGKAFGVIRQLANILPGIGIAGLVSVLSDLVISLFRSSDAFSSTELAAAKFTQSIQEAKEGLQQFISFLDFTSDIDKLKAKLESFGDSNKGEILGLKIDKAKNEKVIDDLIEINDRITSEIAHIRGNAQLFLSKSGQQILDTFSDTDIPDDLINKLSKADKKIITELKAFGTQIKDNRDAISKASKENEAIDINLQIKAAEETKRILDKRRSDYDKFVNDIISRAQKLSSAFKNVIDITPDFSVLDTKQEEFKKALGFLNKFDAGDFKFKLLFQPEPIVAPIEPADIKRTEEEIQNIVKQFRLDPVEIEVPFDASLSPENLANIDAGFKAIQTRSEAAANALAQSLQQGFEGAFEAVGEGLGNILSGQDFGNQITQVFGTLLQQIGKALIAFAVTKKIVDKILANPAIPGGAGLALAAGITAIAAGQLLKNIKPRAAGGPVNEGETYLVGEKGPEIFRPKRSGKIIPNHKVNSYINNRSNKSSNRLTNISSQKVNNTSYKTFLKSISSFSKNFSPSFIKNSFQKSFQNTNVSSKDLKAFSSIKNIFNEIGFRALGGQVQAGRNFVVGERGFEIFVPNTGNQIASNSGAGAGISGGSIRVQGEFVLRGNDLVASLSNTNRSQGRLS